MTAPNRKRATRCPGGPALTAQASREARLLAAAILEVLAGLRTPAQAAEALAVSLPRYYQLEGRALRGLLDACESRPRGPRQDAEHELTAMRQQITRLERDLARQQALVRLAQRTIGLPATPPAPAKTAKTAGKRRRKARARAVPVVARLRKDSTPGPADTTADPTTNADGPAS